MGGGSGLKFLVDWFATEFVANYHVLTLAYGVFDSKIGLDGTCGCRFRLGGSLLGFES